MNKDKYSIYCTDEKEGEHNLLLATVEVFAGNVQPHYVLESIICSHLEYDHAVTDLVLYGEIMEFQEEFCDFLSDEKQEKYVFEVPNKTAIFTIVKEN